MQFGAIQSFQVETCKVIQRKFIRDESAVYALHHDEMSSSGESIVKL